MNSASATPLCWPAVLHSGERQSKCSGTFIKVLSLGQRCTHPTLPPASRGKEKMQVTEQQVH